MRNKQLLPGLKSSVLFIHSSQLPPYSGFITILHHPGSDIITMVMVLYRNKLVAQTVLGLFFVFLFPPVNTFGELHMTTERAVWIYFASPLTFPPISCLISGTTIKKYLAKHDSNLLAARWKASLLIVFSWTENSVFNHLTRCHDHCADWLHQSHRPRDRFALAWQAGVFPDRLQEKRRGHNTNKCSRRISMHGG